MFGIGMIELAVVVGVAMLISGARKLPVIGYGIGKAIQEFKEGYSVESKVMETEGIRTIVVKLLRSSSP